VRELLSPVPRPHWYEARWAWAAGAAVLAAAILIPLTAVVAQNNGPSTWTAKPVYTWP
jgi:hypothetical protein